MRPLMIILSSAVTAGLVVFFGFNAMGAISTLQGSAMMSLDVFVAFIACLVIAASAVTVAFWRLLARGEQRAMTGIEQRIARLEARGPGTP